MWLLDENCFCQFKVADGVPSAVMAQRVECRFQAGTADHAIAGNERRGIVASLPDQFAVEGAAVTWLVT